MNKLESAIFEKYKLGAELQAILEEILNAKDKDLYKSFLVSIADQALYKGMLSEKQINTGIKIMTRKQVRNGTNRQLKALCPKGCGTIVRISKLQFGEGKVACLCEISKGVVTKLVLEK